MQKSLFQNILRIFFPFFFTDFFVLAAADSISNVYVQTFENNVRHLAQQSVTKLRDYVQEVSMQSEFHNWERAGTLEAADKTSRVTPTPVQNLPWSRRRSVPVPFHIGDSTEQEDPVQMLVDPNSNIAHALGMGMKRKVDDIIIAAATGDAQDGTGSPVTFPPAQVVGDGTAPMSFDYITQVQELFMQNDIDPSEPKVFVIGPTQVRKLMQLTEQTSADYVNREALQTLNASGVVHNWMGFMWVMSTRLLVPQATEISCLAFTKRAIGLQVNKDITARVAEDPSVSFAWRIYLHATMGAVRVEDEQIVHLYLSDTLV